VIVSRAHRLGEPIILALGSTAPGGELVSSEPEAGPELALLAHAYGWTPAVIEALTEPQVLYYMRWLPLLEARRAYPIASLEATVLNVAGGKRDEVEDADTASAPTPAHRLFTADERLPPWADLELPAGAWSRESALEAIELASELPVWALELLDFRRLRDLTRGERDPSSGTVLVAARTPAGEYAMIDARTGEPAGVLELPPELGDETVARAHPRADVAIRAPGGTA
jgi:hypothetical protein